MTITVSNVTKAGYAANGKVFTGIRMKFGQNGGPFNYFTPTYPFINQLKCADILGVPTAVPGSPVNGYYDTTTSGNVNYITHSTHPSGGGAFADGFIHVGVWVLRWTGTCDINWTGGTETSSAANRKEYTVSSGTTVTGNLLLVCTGGTCTNIELLCPGEETSFDSGNILHSQFVSDCSGIYVLRTLDWIFGNNSNLRDSADFKPYDHAVWGRDLTGEIGRSTESVPARAMAEAANEIDCALWYIIPPQCTDAAATAEATILQTHLDAGRDSYIEYMNEHFNFASGFSDSAHWNDLGDVAIRDATVVPATGVCTFTAHGLTTEDEVRCFNNQTHNIFPYNVGAQSWVIVDDANTFRLASSQANAAADTDRGAMDSSVTLISFKAVADSSLSADVNYANRSDELWTLFEAQLGAADMFRVAGCQAANVTVMNNILGVAGIREQNPYFAIAPYFTTKPSGYENLTFKEMSDDHEFTEFANWQLFTTNHIEALGAYKIICYECGEHNGGNSGQTQAQLDKIVGWARDDEATRMYQFHFKAMADLGIPIAVNFDSHSNYSGDNGTWGAMEHIGDTDSKEYLGIEPFLSGGVPKN